MATFVTSRRDLTDVEAGVKNKFKWEWLTEVDCNGDFMSDYLRKVADPGVAYCIHCNDNIKYGSGGKNAIRKHTKSKKHLKMREIKSQNQQLPASYSVPSSRNHGVGDSCGGGGAGTSGGGGGGGDLTSHLPYGAAQNIQDATYSNRQMPSKPNISIADRKGNLEALFLSFTAEHGLPLSLIPELVKLAQEASRDDYALNSLSLERTSATYKLTDGIHVALKKRLVADLQKYQFSINLDECTTTANEKVLTILVCYYSEEQGECVVQHYDSVSLTVVNAKTVLGCVTELFSKENIPLDNIVSVLSDSASYMRGIKGGFETLLREKVPHLLDIGGDVCHHIHNIVRAFCKHFGGYVEKFDDDVHNDFKWSPDLKEYLKEICCALGDKYLTPRQRVPHRWLSAYDATIPNLEMFSALTLFYWTWLPDNEKPNYKEIVDEILKDMSPEARKAIKTVHQKCLLKKLTEDGKQRKLRLVEKVFFKRGKTQLLMVFYVEILLKFKEFVLRFERKEPMIHRLYDEQQDLLKWFLSCFIKFEALRKSTKCLTKFNIRDATLHMKERDMYVGQKTETVLKRFHKNDSTKREFLETLKTAYTETAVYMQEKLKTCDVLKVLSALDPKALGHTITYRELVKLKDMLPHLLTEEELSAYAREIRDIQLDESLPPCQDAQGNTARVDHWWALLFSQRKYPSLSKLVKACLSIFTAPQVEQSFSGMNDIINPKTNRLDIKTFSAIQTVRYSLKANHTTSLKLYHRDDVRKDPVDHLIAKHLQTSHKAYVSRLKALANARLEKAKTFSVQTKKSPTKGKKRKISALKGTEPQAKKSKAPVLKKR